jgi:hypothetical protein
MSFADRMKRIGKGPAAADERRLQMTGHLTPPGVFQAWRPAG